MIRSGFFAAVMASLCASACSDSPDTVAEDLASAAQSQVVINEVFPHGSDTLTDPDWAELKNLGTTEVDLSGYRVRDAKGTATLPVGTRISPGAYLVLFCDDVPDGGATDRLHVPFKFGAEDEFHLLLPDGTSIGSVTWTALTAPSGKSLGRLPDGTGQLLAITPSRGARNL